METEYQKVFEYLHYGKLPTAPFSKKAINYLKNYLDMQEPQKEDSPEEELLRSRIKDFLKTVPQYKELTKEDFDIIEKMSNANVLVKEKRKYERSENESFYPWDDYRRSGDDSSFSLFHKEENTWVTTNPSIWTVNNSRKWWTIKKFIQKGKGYFTFIHLALAELKPIQDYYEEGAERREGLFIVYNNQKIYYLPKASHKIYLKQDTKKIFFVSFATEKEGERGICNGHSYYDGPLLKSSYPINVNVSSDINNDLLIPHSDSVFIAKAENPDTYTRIQVKKRQKTIREIIIME